MLPIILLGLAFGTLFACILAPMLRFCLRMVVGEANTFRDAWSICFKGTMAYIIASVVLQSLLKSGDESTLLINLLSLGAQLAI